MNFSINSGLRSIFWFGRTACNPAPNHEKSFC